MARKKRWFPVTTAGKKIGRSRFKVGDRVRYHTKLDNVIWDVVAVRRSETDIRAPSGYLATIVAPTMHLWILA